VLPSARQKFLAYFKGCPEFFTTFGTYYIFIPRFLAESVTTYRETLVGRHLSTFGLNLYFMQKLGHGPAQKVHVPVFVLDLERFFV
jgi:hypothetical protein